RCHGARSARRRVRRQPAAARLRRRRARRAAQAHERVHRRPPDQRSRAAVRSGRVAVRDLRHASAIRRMTMTQPTLLISTRKGLFIAEGSGKDARITRSAFIGDNVALTLADRRDGAWYAALDHGHFGVKLHRSADRGETWTEIAVPAYPPKPEGFVDQDMWGREREWATKNIWALEVAPDADGGLWCGTLPGGLFRSEDHGASWSLVEALWNHPTRVKWNGGGADHAAIHSICVDPRDPRCVVVAVSSGGVWRTRDGGASWTSHTVGMKAGYVPPEQAELPEFQDPHRVVQCPSAPEVFWCQHHMGIWRSTDDLASWQQ